MRPPIHDPNTHTLVRCDSCGTQAFVSVEADAPAPDGWLWACVHARDPPHLVDAYLMVCSLACMRALPWRKAVDGHETAWDPREASTLPGIVKAAARVLKAT